MKLYGIFFYVDGVVLESDYVEYHSYNGANNYAWIKAILVYAAAELSGYDMRTFRVVIVEVKGE